MQHKKVRTFAEYMADDDRVTQEEREKIFLEAEQIGKINGGVSDDKGRDTCDDSSERQ